MQRPKRIVIVAGEESGDMHAASFVHLLKLSQPTLDISGIGGRHMQDEGVSLVGNLAQYGVTGITEVLRNIRILRQIFNTIKAHLTSQKPDLLILIDCPGFNLPLAKFAKRTLGIRILYYISPQIWAWKAGRIKSIRECVDQMAVIFPFEKKIYEDAGVPVAFVGHPLVERMSSSHRLSVTRAQLALPKNKRLIAMLPGSRGHEIERHMPILRDSALNLIKKYSDLHFVIPLASTIKRDLVDAYLKKTDIPYTLVQEQAIETITCSDYVIVASGTASLECALLEKPMCIVYKASLLTYMAASKLIKVRYLGLCNLLQNKMIVPELLQYDCNATELTKTMTNLLNDHQYVHRMQTHLKQLKLSLSNEEADCTIDKLIETILTEPKTKIIHKKVFI
jgi:lipid-A-disaccharide synthase